jgi:hypothetical protein
MGLLPNWSSSSGDAATSATSPKPTQDGAFVAPDRMSRAKCWDARDAFNQCLNRNNILDAIKDKDGADKACGTESQDFEKNCASSWVCHLPPSFLLHMLYLRLAALFQIRLRDEREVEYRTVGFHPKPITMMIFGV